MSESYTGKQFFFVGKAAANRNFSDIPPLDPRSYILQPGSRPLKGEVEPSKKAVEAVEKAIESFGGFEDNAR